MRRLPLVSFIVPLLLAACAGPVGNERVDWDHGARHARVLAVLTPQEAAVEARECLGAVALPDGQPQSQQYVRVRYRLNRLHRNAVAAAPTDMTLRPGDEVELRPEDCDAGRPARIERVLPPLPTPP